MILFFFRKTARVKKCLASERVRFEWEKCSPRPIQSEMFQDSWISEFKCICFTLGVPLAVAVCCYTMRIYHSLFRFFMFMLTSNPVCNTLIAGNDFIIDLFFIPFFGNFSVATVAHSAHKPKVQIVVRVFLGNLTSKLAASGLERCLDSLP